jgi:hypothetical protein
MASFQKCEQVWLLFLLILLYVQRVAGSPVFAGGVLSIALH